MVTSTARRRPPCRRWQAAVAGPAGRTVAEWFRVERAVSSIRTHVTTRERVLTETRIREAGLTALEEKVVRMRAGVAVGPEHALEQHPANAETLRRIEAIEHEAVARLQSSEDAQRKRAIIEQLRQL